MLITKQIELINKKSFTKIALNKKSKTFIVHVTNLDTLEMTIHFLQIVQIINGNPIYIAALKQNEASTKVFIKYLDFLNIFSEKWF